MLHRAERPRSSGCSGPGSQFLVSTLQRDQMASNIENHCRKDERGNFSPGERNMANSGPQRRERKWQAPKDRSCLMKRFLAVPMEREVCPVGRRSISSLF